MSKEIRVHERALYWPLMADEVYKIVGVCKICLKKRPHTSHERWLTRFPLDGKIEIIAIDIFGTLQK